MKKTIIIVLSLCFSCSSVNKIKTDNIKNPSIDNKVCIENLTFKKEFFSKIENVENVEVFLTNVKTIENIDNDLKNVGNDSFNDSLLFISKYCHVSYEDMLNYGRNYSIYSFQKDKKIWLQWYEENKCNNIQLK